MLPRHMNEASATLMNYVLRYSYITQFLYVKGIFNGATQMDDACRLRPFGPETRLHSAPAGRHIMSGVRNDANAAQICDMFASPRTLRRASARFPHGPA
jgi:hypothetical protein